MRKRLPRYEIKAHARRGRDIYHRLVLPKVEAGNRGKIVAIDIDSEEYELGDNTLNACHQLLARMPDAQIWCERVGYPAVHRIGPRRMGRDS